MKIIIGIIIFIILLGVGSLIVPDTEDKNVQILSKYGVEVIARKKDFQKDSCMIEFDITSKNEDLNVRSFTVEIPEIKDVNYLNTYNKVIVHKFIKVQLKKNELQREIKIFSLPCKNLGKMSLLISTQYC